MVGSPSKKNAPYRSGFDIRTYRYDNIVTYSILKFNPKNSIKFGKFPEFIGTKNEMEENVPCAPSPPLPGGCVRSNYGVIARRGAQPPDVAISSRIVRKNLQEIATSLRSSQ